MKDLFDDIFKIFDFDGDGKVDNGEFAMGMAMTEALMEEDDDDDNLFGDLFGSDNDFDDDF